MESKIPKSFLTLFFLLLSISITSSSKTKPCIKKACKQTPFPHLCKTSLTFYTSKTNQITQQELCKAALISALKSAQKATSVITKLPGQKGLLLSPYEAAVVDDCIENLGDSIDGLRKAENGIKKLKGTYDNNVEFLMNGIKTWVSAAETNVYTCIDGLDDGRRVSKKMKIVVKKSVVIVIKKISNALSLINNLSINP